MAHPSRISLPGSIALGALNGAIGDVLAREHEELALPMALRRQGDEVPCDHAGLAHVYRDATPKLAVFVHWLAGAAAPESPAHTTASGCGERPATV